MKNKEYMSLKKMIEYIDKALRLKCTPNVKQKS